MLLIQMFQSYEGAGNMRLRRRTLRIVILCFSLASTFFALRAIVKEHDDIANYIYDAAETRLALQTAAARVLTAGVLEERVNTALDASDVGLARSYYEIAIEQEQTLGAATLRRLDDAETWQATTLRNSSKGTRGCLTGNGESVAHISGAVLCDLTMYGDARDLTKEAVNYAMGRDVDRFVVALSGTGLALTAGTYATAGAAAPVKVSVSLLKFAKKTGRLSNRFGAYLMSKAQAALPMKALQQQLEAVSFRERLTSFHFSGLSEDIVGIFQRSVDPKQAAELEYVFFNLGAIKAATSTETAVRTLKIVDTPQQLTQLRRISEVSGNKSLAYADTFGKNIFGMIKTTLRVSSTLVVKYVWAMMSFVLTIALVAVFFFAERVAMHPVRRLLFRHFTRI